MRFLILIVSAALLAVAAASATSAQHAMVPSLVGTWESATGRMHVVNGQNYALERDAPEAKAIGEIVVSEQNGEVFTGRYRYTHISENSADGSEEQKPMSEETIAGVLDFDGTYIVVEQPDSGIHRFRVIDENTLEVILYRSGPGAVVMRGIFKRRQ